MNAPDFSPAPIRAEHPRLTDDDVRAVARRIERAALALLSVHRLALDATEGDDGRCIAIAELARATFKGLDACIARLTGGPALGNFATEFDSE